MKQTASCLQAREERIAKLRETEVTPAAFDKGFDVEIAHSIKDIGRDAWDHLSQDRPFASYRWYRFGETVLADNVPFYIILSHHGEPVARGTFWLRSREQLSISSMVVRYLIETLLRHRPLLVCRAPLVDSSGLILPEEQALREAALKIVSRVAQEQAQQFWASFLLFDYLGEEETQYAGWPETFLPTTISDPGTYMAIAWRDFDSYLRHLSRKGRKHYRQHCRQAAELGIEVTLQPEVTDMDRTIRLTRNVEKKHRSAPYPWTEGLLENADMVDATWITARIGGRLVGSELVMNDAGVYCVKALGLDYSVPFVYFMLGYADIRYAIEQGARILRWGSGASDAKRRLGFQFEDNNYVVFSGSGPLFQRIGRWTARLA
jgi:predicted N-acyltransferase